MQIKVIEMSPLIPQTVLLGTIQNMSLNSLVYFINPSFFFQIKRLHKNYSFVPVLCVNQLPVMKDALYKQ